MRLCPICTSDNREMLHTLQLTGGEWQSIYACVDCGMVYASLPSVPTDYSDTAIYIAPNAIGSGGTEADRRRLAGVAANLLERRVPLDASILDVGCAQGGLLDALRAAGFTNLWGMDPSSSCATQCILRGHSVSIGTLEDDPFFAYDVLILSHVLEHIPDPVKALRSVKDRLNFGGAAYIEVPDASRYAEGNMPFLDFNSEHINHFCGETLAACCRSAGLHVVSVHLRDMELTNGALYPAVWAWVKRCPQRMPNQKAHLGVMKYVAASTAAMQAINARLEYELADTAEITLWGAGSYLGNVLSLPAIQSRFILQVVDRNPALKGKWLGQQAGCVVSPDQIMYGDGPIVIAALVAAESIKSDIRRMGLTGKVITLEGM